MAKLREIVIDADHPASLAQFWAAAVDGYAVRSYDDAEIARLAKMGLTPETDRSVLIDGPGPIICCQLREGPRLERNRIHLDLATTERPSEVARLQRLGATVWYEESTFTVLRDPEGNQFCIADARE
jgi:hypothetical protein